MEKILFEYNLWRNLHGFFVLTENGGREDEKVAILMGSDSDFGVMSKAVSVLKEFEIPVEVHVIFCTSYTREGC